MTMKMNETYTTYELNCLNGKDGYLVGDNLDIAEYHPEEFEILTGCSQSNLEHASRTGGPVYLECIEGLFSVEKSVVTAAELARDEAYADFMDAQALLGRIDPAAATRH